MPLETATYISQLVATNPDGSVDKVSTVDNHLKLIKDVLQKQFPNFTAAAMNATVAQLNLMVGLTSAPIQTGVLTTLGDILYRGASSPSRLAIGSTNQVLSPVSGVPAWATLATLLAAAILTVRGDLVVRGASTAQRLAIGGANTILASNGTDPSWQSITSAMLASGIITQTKIANSAVGQAQLKTTTQGITSNTIGNGGVFIYQFTSAGAYAFTPIYTAAGGTIGNLTLFTDSSVGWATAAYPSVEGTRRTPGSGTHTVTIRYVQSSPPWSFGDGDIPLFVWLRFWGRKLAGIVVCPDAPWNYAIHEQRRAHLDLDNIEEGIDSLGSPRELTREEKLSFHDKCPHPWAHAPDNKEGQQIVLLDPVSGMMEKLLKVHEEADIGVGELIEKDYLRFGNEDLPRARVGADLVVEPKWRNNAAY